MGGAGDVAVLDVELRLIVEHVHGEMRLKQAVGLFPIHCGIEVHALDVRGDHVVLGDRAVAGEPFYPYDTRHGTHTYDFDLNGLFHLPGFFPVIDVDVPGVVVVGSVLIIYQAVQPLPGLDQLPVLILVHKGGYEHVVIETSLQRRRLKAAFAQAYPGRVLRPVHEEHGRGAHGL